MPIKRNAMREKCLTHEKSKLKLVGQNKCNKKKYTHHFMKG
jgi:hypothetical protein